MRIDKVVFSCSEAFSPWWNIQSKIWKTKFGIEPVCLLFGDKKNCPVSEEYGNIVEMQYNPTLPKIIQIQFSKFYYPKTEPDTTWIIGDMDQIPLQTEYFLDGLESVSEDAYANLNYTLTAQMRPGIRSDGYPGIPADSFVKRGGAVNGGYDLPGHYHVAKGKLFEELFFKDKTFEEVVRYVMESKRYGFHTEESQKTLTKAIHGEFWVAEESYTSEQLWYGLRRGIVKEFYGKEYHIWNQKIDRVGRLVDSNGKWIPQWNGTNYIYDEAKLRNKGYMDLHCHRPYHEQEKAMLKILEIARMI
jgi:hypothetical protein